ncbi:MAG: MGH1-like glycoside hydrolase domain-containing protein [Terriglobia bacterium]
MLRKAAALAALPFLPRPGAPRPRRTTDSGPNPPAPIFHTDDAKLQAKYDAALAGLAQNQGRVFRFPRPVLKEGATYTGVWLESGPYEGLLFSPFDPGIAISNHQVFFDLQRADGYLPCCVRTDRIETSQIQMVVPIAATALELFERLQDEAFLATAYRGCSAWDDWLARYRNTRGTGLCEAFCGYDTGEDNSARFKGLPWKCPNDDARICPKVGALPYLAPDLSATVYGGRLALARMATLLGKRGEASRWEERAASIRQAMMKWCFDPEDVCFYDRDRNNHFVRIRSVALIVVLGEHAVDQKLFAEIYRRHIRNPQEFWTPYPFPSVAADDPVFNHALPENCWGGPSQALTALRAPRWMEYYGKYADLTFLMRRWIHALTASAGFEQQVNPWTGAFSTGAAYSPAMLLLTDFVARLYGVRREEETIQWNCRLPEGANQLRFSLPVLHGTAELSIQKTGGTAPSCNLTLAGKKLLTIEGVVRVNTDAAGKPLSLLGTEPIASRVILTWPGGRQEQRTLLPDETLRLA